MVGQAGHGAKTSWALLLRPNGHVGLEEDPEGKNLPSEDVLEVRTAFARRDTDGIWMLLERAGALEGMPSLAFGAELARDALRALSALSETSTDVEAVRRAVPPDHQIVARIEAAPPFRGSERLEASIGGIYARLAQDVAARMSATETSLGGVLSSLAGGWHARGRVWLHLAENTEDGERPFALLATFTPPGDGAERHTPLSAALDVFRGERDQLLGLLAPVARAAERSDWFKRLLDSGEIFHPLALTAEEAHAFVRSADRLEGTGVRVRLPKKWGRGPRPKPGVQVRIGELPARLDLGALLSFDCRLALPDGSALTPGETAKLLEGVPRLEWLRGQWVDIDPTALRETFEAWTSDGRATTTVAEGLRFVAGLDAPSARAQAWSEVSAGGWLSRVLSQLRSPGYAEPSPRLKGELRPYQKEGLAWLASLFHLGLGGCLADDMGLGKTLQVIATLLQLKDQRVQGPSLVIVPTSLIGNWTSEITRFGPDLRVLIAHRSVEPARRLRRAFEELDDFDVVLTSYGSLGRHPQLAERTYPLLVLDEAQAIKNPGTRQAQQVRRLRSRCRIALTGTPIENRLGDLWALFAFLNPGLLGSKEAFGRLAASLTAPEGPGFRPLRRLVQPYMLRRLKNDPRITPDLPDKSEVTTWCPLSRRQAALYKDAVQALEKALQTSTSKDRRGLVLSYLTRFKQICNHPSQWLQDAVWDPEDSGKMRTLACLGETLKQRQEKVLVFTQYRAITSPLARFLSEIFQSEGLVLHGGIPARKRTTLVEAFQDPSGPPFFVLSLKAGGTGLNLTAANHVVHFDRWWNPAVENQATDRAYRIGQHRNVLVHRFVCRGTLEERIDAMLAAKQQLAEEILTQDGEIALTEMSDDELLDVVRLDRARALDQEVGP